MLTIQLMIKGQTQPSTIVTLPDGVLYDLLMVFEKSEDIIQYRITSTEGVITDLYANFGWFNEWPKLVGEFNWRKNFITPDQFSTEEK